MMRNFDQYSGRDYRVRVARDGCRCGPLSPLGFHVEPEFVAYRCLHCHCLLFVIELEGVVSEAAE